MKRLLIANRGEIAVRIIRACREEGISPVAIYSEADRNALHIRRADAAVCIGPGPASESYLRPQAILDAARKMNADSIHPGYGFLSESAEFADAAIAAGLTWVGPTPEAIRRVGDKIAARRLMAAHGVPVVPGYDGDEQDDARLLLEARQVGFPVLVKAAAGGGGRGMRVAEDIETLPAKLDEARREAESAFGDTRLLLERYVARPRHVEFQVFGDVHGNIVHLFERDCSIQRRHQKILEESPAPHLSEALRARMAQAAITAAQAAGYSGAGTVEFLLDEAPDGGESFYFLEVNARLQVEHPVTELLTGRDLVRLQLQVAWGEPLGFSQDQVAVRGHVIEARIYAENAAAGFLPSPGLLAHWREPSGPGVRVDTGVEQGSEISPYYDPMLAKLVVQGGTRTEALERLRRALREFQAVGVCTNLEYLADIVAHPVFQAGDVSTRFLTEHFADWRPSDDIPDQVLLALAMEAVTRPGSVDSAKNGTNPWQALGAWRNV